MPPFSSSSPSSSPSLLHQYGKRPRSREVSSSLYADNKTKMAIDGMEGCILTILDLLEKEGVSRCSISELKQCLVEGRYQLVLERTQSYAECLTSKCSREHNKKDQDSRLDLSTLTYLIVSSWALLSQTRDLQYKKAHRYYHGLRRNGETAGCAPAPPAELQRALHTQVNLAEAWCASQKGLILAQNWEKRLLATCTAT